MAIKGKRTLVPIREQLYEQIKEQILTNSYKPGEVLQIDRLADEFGVSATPVREALIRLEGSGFLELVPNKGVQVTGIRPQDIRDTWETRRILEPYAGSLAALLPLENEIRTLRNRSELLLSGPFDFDLYADTDIKIHELFYLHLTNTLLKETIQRIHQISMRMRYYAESETRTHDATIEEVTREHITILDAMAAHDAAATAAAIELHLVNGEKRTITAVAPGMAETS